jgi:hypothetical protein
MDYSHLLPFALRHCAAVTLLVATNGLRSANIDAPAVFTVNQVVCAPNPGPWTATTPGGTVNEVNSGGGFEPLCFKTRWRAAGNAQDAIVLAESDINGWDSYNEGFYAGSTVRIYRAVDNRLVKVREDTIAAHHVKQWLSYEDNTVDENVTTYQLTFPDWTNPDCTYYFAVRAVDDNGNLSPYSNVVSTPRNTVSGGTVTNSTHSFTAPANPTESVPPAAPANLALSINEATGIITLQWSGVSDSDLNGYRIYLSYWPPQEHTGLAIELAGRATDEWQYVREGDLIYVDRTRTEWNAVEVLSPRIWATPFAGYPLYWPWDNQNQAPGRVQHLVPHPEPIPANFTDRGQTCLHVSTSIEGDEVRMVQYNHAGTSQTWYQVLEVGATYVVEAWMRQEGIEGGRVTFRLGGDYGGVQWDDPTDISMVNPIDFTVTGEWVKYTGTFVIPSPYTEEGIGTTELVFNGPGQLWLDNFRVYKQGTAFMDWPAEDFAELEDSNLEALRTHQFIKSGLSYTMQTLTSPGGVCGGRGNDTGNDHTLPVILSICERAGINPWLQIESSQSEAEWLGMIEYLAAPYDPAVDTPLTKPWAYKRYMQGHPAPWSDSFETIYFEISNEMWNGMSDFAPWSISGLTMPDAVTGETHQDAAIQGMLQEYIDTVIESSPYWPRLSDRWEVVVGGWNGSTDEDSWGFAAVKKCPDIKHVTWANYNGGWDEGALPLTADDAGRFLALSVVPHSMDASNRSFAQARDNMTALGYDIDIGTYEAGPGYSLNGLNGASITEAQEEAESQVMKGLCGGTGTLDCFLDGALYGMKLQNFFCFERGRTHWRSHARQESGLQPYPAWLAMEMFNKHGLGDLLAVTTNSTPTADLAETLTRPQVPNAPMAACYATRDGDRYNVFVLSRILDNYPAQGDDGYIPVTINLPFTSCTGMRVIKMSGDPRAHNLDAYNIKLVEEAIPLGQFSQTFTLNAARGADDRGLPPASSFLYIFEGATSEQVPDNPQPVISVAAGTESPTLLLPIGFDVVFSEPVTGFDESDVQFSGSAPVLEYTVQKDPRGAGAIYTIKVLSLGNSGTLTPHIAAGSCTGTQSGRASLASTYTGQPALYDLPPAGGVAVNYAIADAVVQTTPGDNNTYRGADIDANLRGTVADEWGLSYYLRFPVVSCLDRSISSATLRLYKRGNGVATVAARSVENDGWREMSINGSNMPPWGGIVGSASIPATEGYVDIDVTGYVQAEAAKDSTVSLIVSEVTHTSGDSIVFITREGPGQGWPPYPSCPPVMEITWGASNGLDSCMAPEFDNVGGIFTRVQHVTISCDTPDATIRYTTDGSIPSAGNGTDYTGPVTISHSCILRAVALREGWNSSSVRNATFDIYADSAIAPTAQPAAGSYAQTVNVVLTSDTPGATIRFTLDGTTPDHEYGYIYKGPINISETTTIKAVAYVDELAPSPVATHRYVLNEHEYTDRVLAPRGGSLTSPSEVSEYNDPIFMTDDSIWTNWQADSASSWVQMQFPSPYSFAISRYGIGSTVHGVDTAPCDWQLLGSHNGVDWVALDTRSDVVFYAECTTQYYDVPAPAAYEYYRLDFTNYSGNDYSTIGNFELLEASPVVPDFSSWRDAHFSDNEIAYGMAADDRDDDGDGMTVLMEYAFGTDPRHSDRPLFQLAPLQDGSSAELVLNLQPRNDLTILVEESADLAVWNVIASSLNGAPFSTSASVTNLTSSGTYPVTFTFQLQLGGAEPRFFRVTVTR